MTINIPPQGPITGPGGNPQSPTLVPNFSKPIVGLSGGGSMTPAQFLAANPRVDATATATITGSITAGDIVTIAVTTALLKDSQFGTLPNGTLSKSYTVLAADTTATIAEQLADMFNDDVNAANLGLRADAGGPIGNVITFRQNGPVGNFTVITTPNDGQIKVTIGGTALTGDSVYVNFSGGALGVITPALCQVELSGVVGVGDTIPLVFTNTNIAAFPITKTYTVVAGDTLASIAAGVVALVNADTTLEANGVMATAEGNGFAVTQQGVIGNSTTLSCTPGHGGGGSEAIAFTPASGTLAGGAGQVGGVTVSQAVTTAQSTTTVATNLKNAINANVDLVALGITATSSGAIVTLVIPVVDDPIVVTSWANTAAPIITITGTLTIGDVLNAIFTTTPSGNLPGSPLTVSYTCKALDTVTLMAAGLAAAINANAALSAFGISATSALGVVTIAGFNGSKGQIRLTTSVTGTGTETLTPSAVPTDTAVTGTTASESIGLISGPVASATATATLGGSETNGDVVSLVFTNAGVSGLPVTISHTASGAESLASIAGALNTSINGNSTLIAAGITSTVSGAVLTISQPGVIGNTTVLSYTQGGNSETITFAPTNGHMGGGTGAAGAPATLGGGSGPVFATSNFSYSRGGQVQDFLYGQPYVLDYPYLSAAVNEGRPFI